MAGSFYIILACMLWSLDSLIRFPLIQEGVSAIFVVFFEHLVLSVLFFIPLLLSFKKIWNAKISHFFYFFIVGGIGSALSTLAFTRAFYFLNPSLVILLQKFQPVIAVLLAHYFLKEKIKGTFIFWALICLLGGFLISYQDLSLLFSTPFKLKGGSGTLMGYVLVLFSIAGWGAATVFGKKLSTLGYENKDILAGRFVMGFLCLLPFFYAGSSNFSLAPFIYLKILLMVLVTGLLAMFIYYKGLKITSARTTSLLEMFFPFFAVIVNWLFLGATLTVVELIGGGVLLLGSFVIQWKKY